MNFINVYIIHLCVEFYSFPIFSIFNMFSASAVLFLYRFIFHSDFIFVLSFFFFLVDLQNVYHFCLKDNLLLAVFTAEICIFLFGFSILLFNSTRKLNHGPIRRNSNNHILYIFLLGLCCVFYYSIVTYMFDCFFNE